MTEAELLPRELERFEREHPRSRELALEAEESLLAGVPMPWMIRWAGGFPVFAVEAHGARFRDVEFIIPFCVEIHRSSIEDTFPRGVLGLIEPTNGITSFPILARPK